MDLIPEEFYDILDVLEFGAKKHGAHNWLEYDGNKSDFITMHHSMFHHLSESWSQGICKMDRGDVESDFDPLLHLAIRALMCYTRLKRDMY